MNGLPVFPNGFPKIISLSEAISEVLIIVRLTSFVWIIMDYPITIVYR